MQPTPSVQRTDAPAVHRSEHAKAKGPSLDQAASKPGHAFRPGDHGPGVEKLQHLMNTAGAHVPVTGKYDAATQHAVKAFQSKKKLDVDGLAGMHTIHALRTTVAHHGGHGVGEHRAPTPAEHNHRPSGTHRAGDLQHHD